MIDGAPESSLETEPESEPEDSHSEAHLERHHREPIRRRRLFRIVIIATLLALPGIIYMTHRMWTALPGEIRIASGPHGGQYVPIAEGIGQAIKEHYPGIDVKFVDTAGSLENLRLLQNGQIDFALYQPGVEEMIGKMMPVTSEPEKSAVAFVANMYRQPVHLLVRKNLVGGESDDVRKILMNKNVALGLGQSGDRAMSQLLLRHLGLEGKVNEMFSGTASGDYYEEVRRGFADPEGALDAAILTVGPRAAIFDEIAQTGQCVVLSVPDRDALVDDNLYLTPYTIHSARYGSRPLDIPSTDVDTMASGAQLLARADVNPYLVEALAGIVLDKSFARKNHLKDLFESKGHEFAMSKPEFPVHQGARSIYDPAFDIHLIESWEAFYSLTVSIFVAVFLGVRWLQKRAEMAKEHRLDRYIQSLLEIEQRQISLDGQRQVEEDVTMLQGLLDEVTMLRQEALCEFTAHELTDDSAADSFIRMCHALSSKINAKLSRQRLDMMMLNLIEAVKGSGASSKEDESSRP